MHTEEIRRSDNGTIDIDFYRRRAVSMRIASMTNFLSSMSRMARPIVAIAALALTAYSFVTRPPSASELRSPQDVQVKRTLPLPVTIEPI